MTSRKTQQEIEKTFKKVAEGISTFDSIYDKIRSTTNLAQRDKLEDNLKREIKKLQRFRDQIKSWAAGNEVKDKNPLLEQRRAIETCMEQFKAVEKEMKTKAYSKEGLSAAARLDPKEKEKAETCEFLSTTVDTLQQKIESMEAEEETLHASMKKGKKDPAKTTRLADISRILDRHKWHVGKLELLLRALQNGNVDTNQVLEVKDSIKYYAEDGHNADFYGEDETIYDDLDLGDEEAAFGMNNDEPGSSQDTQSVEEDQPAPAAPAAPATNTASVTTTTTTTTSTTTTATSSATANNAPAASSALSAPSAPSGSAAANTGGASGGNAADRSTGDRDRGSRRGRQTETLRRSSTQIKSPLPALSTLHMNAPNSTTPASTGTRPGGGPTVGGGLAPGPSPTPARVPGETLKYASAAAAAAASDKSGVGIAPLPPPPGAPAPPPAPANAGANANSNANAKDGAKSGPQAAISSPQVASAQPARKSGAEETSAGASGSGSGSGGGSGRSRGGRGGNRGGDSGAKGSPSKPAAFSAPAQTPTAATAAPSKELQHPPPQPEQPVFHLPPGLSDLVESFDTTKAHASAQADTGPLPPSTTRLLLASHAGVPDPADAEKPFHYVPTTPYPTPEHYPQEPLAMFDDRRLYEMARIDTDTLFYIFYYRQGTYQQYLAARALKNQSWRFHKQYQTWFQRHEEPKTITEEFEQGTYRFFDYESTW